MRIKKIFSSLLIFILLTITSIYAIFLVLSRTNGNVISSGHKRGYILYVPESYQAGELVPLVISIHGFASWPAQQQNISQFNTLADEYGFIVVYPRGRGFPLRWQTGYYGDENPLIDVIFIEDLIDKLMENYTIDPTRVYVNGFSNGGGMAFLLGCVLADRITAIGTVAGAYALPDDKCKPYRSVPLITFHGIDDPIVPYDGGIVSNLGYTLPSISNWVKSWVRRDGCNINPLDIKKTEEVEAIKYSGCEDDVEVQFYKIIGGGHSWPGGQQLPRFIVGFTTEEINASSLMWEFFQQYKLDK